MSPIVVVCSFLESILQVQNTRKMSHFCCRNGLSLKLICLNGGREGFCCKWKSEGFFMLERSCFIHVQILFLIASFLHLCILTSMALANKQSFQLVKLYFSNKLTQIWNVIKQLIRKILGDLIKQKTMRDGKIIINFPPFAVLNY